MTPNKDANRNLAFWRMEVNASMPHLDMQTKEQVAVEAWRLHMGYVGLGSPYGLQAALNNINADRAAAERARLAAEAEKRKPKYG